MKYFLEINKHYKNSKNIISPEFHDTKWVFKPGFLINLTTHLKKLNMQLQKPNNLRDVKT